MPVEEMKIAATLVVKGCPVCGMNYAIPKDMESYKWNLPHGHQEKGWYCPNGHYLVHKAHEVERLREQVKSIERQKQTLRASNDHLVASRNAVRGAMTKLKKRVKNGVCPCCTRSFVNLARHMVSKHPGYAEQVHIITCEPLVEVAREGA